MKNELVTVDEKTRRLINLNGVVRLYENLTMWEIWRKKKDLILL